MMDTSQLFWKRMKTSWLRASQFMRQVVSGGGTPLFVGMILIFVYFGYTETLKSIPAGFPLIPLVSFIVALFLTWSRMRTWIQPADKTFLLPMEAEMAPYFRASLIYSSIMGLIRLSLLAIALSPLYLVKMGTMADYLSQWFLFALLQIWNGWAYWRLLRMKLHHRLSFARWMGLIRFLFNWGFAAALFMKNGWACALLTIILLFATFGLVRWVPAIPYPWLSLQRQEQKTRARYLAIARWFGNIPGIQNPIQPRTWLIRIIEWFMPKAPAYPYLLWRTLLRRTDFLQIYIGILVWAAFLSISLPHPWIILATCLSGVWMAGIQLPSLLHPNFYPVWIELYPIDDDEFGKALSSVGWRLLIFLTLILSGFLALGGFLPPSWIAAIAISCLIMSGILCANVLPKKARSS